MATRTIPDNYQTNNLTANNCKHAYNYDNAFCLIPNNLQSLSLSHSIPSNSSKSNSKHFVPHKILHQSNSKTKPHGLPSKVTSIYTISIKNSRTFPQGFNTIQITTWSPPKLNTFDKKSLNDNEHQRKRT